MALAAPHAATSTALSLLIAILLSAASTEAVRAADWPMWRHDAARSGVGPETLPEKLALKWVLELAAPKPAWPNTQGKIQFDRLYEPVLAGKRLFVPSMISDRLTAHDTDTGEELWRFYAAGPMRFAPVVWKDRVFTVSDDGYLYCLAVDTGEVLWKFQAVRSARKLLGNQRLISAWPVRGAPVVADDGTLYFGASIWPFMGIYYYALDAETGEEKWRNTGTGSRYLTQQHNSPAFAGAAPQGYFAVSGDHLIVAGGRTVPAVLDRHTGAFQHFNVASRAMGSKGGGGYEVIAGENFYLNRGQMYRLDNGQFIANVDALIVNSHAILARDNEGIRGYEPRWREVTSVDRRGKKTTRIQVKKLFTYPVDARIDTLFIQSGRRVYASGRDREILAIDLPDRQRGAEVSWSTEIDDEPLNMIAGDGKLFVSTDQGRIYCFGGGEPRETGPAPVAELTLVPRGATWAFRDDAAQVEPAWRMPDLDDAAWPRGPAPLGYGEDFVRTEIDYGGDSDRKRLAAYFRHVFDLPNDVRVGALDLDIQADDGAVVYLNGQEVARIRLPDATIGPATRAQTVGDEGRYESLALDVTPLRRGRNVLAVSVHQTSPSSSDLVLDAELTATLLAAEGDDLTAATSRVEDARRILDATSAHEEGYALTFGHGAGRLAAALAAESDLHVVFFEPDARRVASLRRALDDRGLYGPRVAALEGELEDFELPAYMAELIVDASSGAGEQIRRGGEAFVRRVFHSLRPYSGVFCAALDSGAHSELEKHVAAAELDGAELSRRGELSLLKRLSPPEGAASWTHQYGDMANSVSSTDELVKAPLGLLWFGGPSNEGILPRHGHGPAPQVAAGRLFIEGRDLLRAVDIYTGRLLWEKQLEGVGKHYDYTSHEPGANALGSNYVSLHDAVYVVHEGKCLRLDPATGETLARFELPSTSDESDHPDWGYIGVWEDILVGGAYPEDFRPAELPFSAFGGMKGDRLEELEKAIAALKSFDPVPHEKPADKRDENDRRTNLFVNFNKLLKVKHLGEKIPLRVLIKKEAEQLVAGYEKYLEEVPGRKPTDHEALVRKRKVLARCYGLPEHRPEPPGKFGSTQRRGSKRLVALDRYSGEALWEHETVYQARHNAIAGGAGKVFFIDSMSAAEVSYRRRRGLPVNEKARIVALDIRTGEPLWTFDDRIFGTWLGYSQEHDVLLQAGAKARDRARDEVGKGMVALRGADGEVLWSNDRDYSGPCVLLGDRVITQGYGTPGYALDIRTGEPITVRHPITGVQTEWKYKRNYGCNTAIGSPHLLTFRSAAAGYYDLRGEAGTGNLGGFRSGCTSNLIAAGGILNAPDYTRTCTCSYQNQASLALIHMPEVEMWTFSAHGTVPAAVKAAGINFGAPGDRRGPDGTFWIDYPSVGGGSPDVAVRVFSERVRYLRRHSAELSPQPLRWVGASALLGSGEIAVQAVARADEELFLPGQVEGSVPLQVEGASICAATPMRELPGGSLPNRTSLARAPGRELEAKLANCSGLATESVTVELWAKADEDLDFIDARVSGDDRRHGFVLDERRLRARYYVADEDGRDNEDVVELAAKDRIPDNRWTHLAFTYDAGTGVGKLYRDGEVVASHDGPDGRSLWWDVPSPSAVVGKGAGSDTALDELRICRRALKREEFLDHGGASVATADIIGHWRMGDLGAEALEDAPRYDVDLVFAELENAAPGERVFDVLLQGRVVLRDFDIAREAGGPLRTVIRQFEDVPVAHHLWIELRPKGDLPASLSGVQLQRGARGF